MRNFETKTVLGQTADVDTKSRRVKVVISETGSKDLDNDVIDGGAYTKTIKERGPKGSNLIWHLTDHMPSLKNAIGKPREIYMEGKNLVFVTDIPSTTWGNDMMEHYSAGTINQHSIGFRTIKSEPVGAGTPEEYRLIKEVLLYEGSAVLWAANPNTPTLTVGKSMTKEQQEKDFFDTIKEINNFTYGFRKGNFSDESLELMEMHLIQKTEKLQQLFSLTQPAQAVEPKIGEDVLNAIKSFNNILTLQNYARLNAGGTA